MHNLYFNATFRARSLVKVVQCIALSVMNLTLGCPENILRPIWLLFACPSSFSGPEWSVLCYAYIAMIRRLEEVKGVNPQPQMSVCPFSSRSWTRQNGLSCHPLYKPLVSWDAVTDHYRRPSISPPIYQRGPFPLSGLIWKQIVLGFFMGL